MEGGGILYTHICSQVALYTITLGNNFIMSIFTKGALEFEKGEDETTEKKKDFPSPLMHSSYMATELRAAETCMRAS